MRIRDWSSDVCSSELNELVSIVSWATLETLGSNLGDILNASFFDSGEATIKNFGDALQGMDTELLQNLEGAGRSEERRVGKSVSVRVDLGVRRIIKKKTITRQTQD